MKRIIQGICVALALASVGVQAQQTSSDEDVIVSIEHDWVQAIAQQDRAKLDRLLDDQYVEITPAGKRRTKADALEAPPLPSGSSQTLEDLQVHMGDNETAVVTGVDVYRQSAHDEARSYRFIDVLKRRADGWRIVSSHMSQ